MHPRRHGLPPSPCSPHRPRPVGWRANRRRVESRDPRRPSLGGELVVDGYGIGGLGAYRIAFDDGTTALAVCIQADIGHSLAAVYVADRFRGLPAELGYLAWALPGRPPGDRRGGGSGQPPGVALHGAQRSTGGAVWQGDDVEVRRARRGPPARRRGGGGAAARRGDGAARAVVVRRRGVGGSTASVRIVGPGGPIAGASGDVRGRRRMVQRRRHRGGRRGVGRGPGGRRPPVSVRAAGPGDAVALLADGSQRLAMAGPPAALVASLVVPPTTTTPTTTTPTTTTAPRRRRRPTTTTTTTTTTTSSTTTTTTCRRPRPRRVPSTDDHRRPRPRRQCRQPRRRTPTRPVDDDHHRPTATTGAATSDVAASDAAADGVGQPWHHPIGAGMFAAGAAVLWSVRRRPAGAGRRRPSSP